MAVTIQQIAEKAGVSRGTVDRALNHRGRINQEVSERICRIAQEMGYEPKTRKRKSKGLKIGVITQLAKSDFMCEINRGIQRAGEMLTANGIEMILKEGEAVSEKGQLKAMEELEAEEIGGLALMPVDSDAVREKINYFVEEKNIPVVTFNSDIVGSKRQCYVGMDNWQSGRTAAGLMGMLTRGTGKVLVITGYFSNRVNSTRVEGFVKEIKDSYPGIELAGVQVSFDEASEVKKIIMKSMLDIPGINGIFVVSGGQKGIEDAYRELHLEKRPYTIVYDLTPENRKSLREGVTDFLIDQEGYVQGYESLCILEDLLLKGNVPEEEYRFTDISIRTRYNI